FAVGAEPPPPPEEDDEWPSPSPPAESSGSSESSEDSDEPDEPDDSADPEEEPVITEEPPLREPDAALTQPTRMAVFNGRLPEYAGPLTLAQTINAALADALLAYPQMV